MKKLIKTFKNTDNTTVVDGRDLHQFLGVKEKYTQWFDRMQSFGFEENTDFIGLSEKSEKPTGGRPQLNHALTLDMAKELSMIQRTEKGKQARQYFIQMEKVATQPHLPQTPAEKIDLLLENAGDANKMLHKIEHRVTDLEDNQALNPGEYNYLSKKVNNAVTEYISIHHLQLNKQQRPRLFKDINRGVNEVTGVKTRSQLRKKDFNVADEFISNWSPSTATLTVIKQLGYETEGQLEFNY